MCVLTWTLGYRSTVETVRVGELARRTGVTIRALRCHEAAVLVVPARLPNGYPDYEPMAVRQVEEIRALNQDTTRAAQPVMRNPIRTSIGGHRESSPQFGAPVAVTAASPGRTAVTIHSKKPGSAK